MSQPRNLHIVTLAPCELCKRDVDVAALTPVTRKGDLRELTICVLCWIEHDDKLVPCPLDYKLKTRATKRRATAVIRLRGRVRSIAGDRPGR